MVSSAAGEPCLPFTGCADCLPLEEVSGSAEEADVMAELYPVLEELSLFEERAFDFADKGADEEEAECDGVIVSAGALTERFRFFDLFRAPPALRARSPFTTTFGSNALPSLGDDGTGLVGDVSSGEFFSSGEQYDSRTLPCFPLTKALCTFFTQSVSGCTSATAVTAAIASRAGDFFDSIVFACALDFFIPSADCAFALSALRGGTMDDLFRFDESTGADAQTPVAWSFKGMHFFKNLSHALFSLPTPSPERLLL